MKGKFFVNSCSYILSLYILSHTCIASQQELKEEDGTVQLHVSSLPPLTVSKELKEYLDKLKKASSSEQNHVRSQSAQFREERKKIGRSIYYKYEEEYLKWTPWEKEVYENEELLRQCSITEEELANKEDLQGVKEGLFNPDLTPEERENLRKKVMRYDYERGRRKRMAMLNSNSHISSSSLSSNSILSTTHTSSKSFDESINKIKNGFSQLRKDISQLNSDNSENLDNQPISLPSNDNTHLVNVSLNNNLDNISQVQQPTSLSQSNGIIESQITLSQSTNSNDDSADLSSQNKHSSIASSNQSGSFEDAKASLQEQDDEKEEKKENVQDDTHRKMANEYQARFSNKAMTTQNLLEYISFLEDEKHKDEMEKKRLQEELKKKNDELSANDKDKKKKKVHWSKSILNFGKNKNNGNDNSNNENEEQDQK
jgi:hypothetical protein